MKRGLILGTVAILVLAPVFAVAQSSGRPVVAVANIKVATANVNCRRGCDRLAEGFRTMLETAIVKSRKMRVFERADLDPVLAEQLLGQTGVTTAGGKIGGLTSVDYIVQGAITKLGQRREGLSTKGLSAFGGNFGKFGSMLSTNKATMSMGVDLKVTNVKSGNIVIADRVEGTVTTGEAFSVGGISSASGSADAYADVQRVVAAKISEAVVTSRIPIKIIKKQANGTFVLNYGNVFLKEGDILSAFSVGEQIVDPDTKEVLGAEETLRGSVVVTESRQKFAKARYVADPFEIANGDVLRRPTSSQKQKQPTARQQSGPSWDSQNDLGD